MNAHLKPVRKIVLIGSGNVAWNLVQELPIAQIYARNVLKAAETGAAGKAPYVTDLKNILPNADVYIISVSDDGVQEFSEKLKKYISPSAIVAHTSGTLPMNVLTMQNRGVLYPLQTFSKYKKVNFAEVPFLIEASNEHTAVALKELAGTISRNVSFMDSQQRKEVHVAAVLACNFTNRLYALAQERLDRKGISFELLKPLIKESVEKMMNHPGKISDLQTGPAVRGDVSTMQEHMKLLENDKELREIYKMLSNSINKNNNGKF